MLKVIIGSLLLVLAVLIVRGIKDYQRNRLKLEALDEAKQDSEDLEIEEDIALERRYQREKQADIDEINSDKKTDE